MKSVWHHHLDVMGAALCSPDGVVRDSKAKTTIEGQRGVHITDDEIQLVQHRLCVGHHAFPFSDVTSCSFALIRSAPFSAIMMVAAFVFARGIVGMTDASTTRSLSIPWTRSSG